MSGRQPNEILDGDELHNRFTNRFIKDAIIQEEPATGRGN